MPTLKMINVTITIIMIVLSLIFSKSKIVAVLFFLFMWTLWGWNTWNGDFDAYQYRYDNIDSLSSLNTYEIGFEFISYLSNLIGFDFSDFMILISFTSLSLILFFCLKFSKYPALYSAIYFMIFIMEFVFIRNYLVHSLILLAFILVFNEVRNYKIWFAAIVIFASTIHSTAIVLLFFLYAITKVEIISLKNAILFFTLMLLLSIVLFKTLIPFFGFEYVDKFDYYGTAGGLSTSFFAHIFIVLLIYSYFKIVLDKGEDISEYQRRIYTIVINVNIVSLFFLSIYYHIPYFSRILRFIFTFDLVFLLSGFYYIHQAKYKVLMSIIFLSVLTVVVVMFAKSTLSLTLFPMYLCNSIWGDHVYIPDFDLE